MKGVGYCIIDDKPLLKDGRLTDEYTEVEVKWSNQSKMKIALCKDCATGHKWDTPEGKKQITDWHHLYWEMHGGKVDKEVVIV